MKSWNWDMIGAVFIALVGLFAVCVVSSGILTGCNGTTYHEPAASEEPPVYSTIQSAVLTPHCIACHGAGSPRDLTTIDAVLKYVVPGKPEESPLYKRIANGSMPPSGKLPDSYIGMVREWIEDGAPQSF